MNLQILEITEKTQQMPNTKASQGGEKITVIFTCWRDDYLHNRTDVRIVFHHDMVFITEIRYYERFVRDNPLRGYRGHREKSNFSKPIKSSHPFDICIHGCTYDGRGLEPLAMADMALKMYRNQYIYLSPNGNKYLMGI